MWAERRTRTRTYVERRLRYKQLLTLLLLLLPIMYEIYFKSLAPKLTAILRYEEDVFKIYFMIEAYKVFVFLRKEIET